MPRSDGSRWWIAAEVTLVVALVATPWSLGGAPAWTLWMVVALGALALALWTLGAARNHRRWTFDLMLLLPAFAVVVSLLQLVPLPPALLGLLSKPAAELREFALVPLGLEGWRPISLDPPATARACARYIGLGSILFVAIELSRREDVRRRLLAVQVLVGVSIAVCGVGHLLAGVDQLFGVHQFIGNPALITPFGNTNHLAAFLALSSALGIAMALSARSRDAAIGWAVAALFCGVCVFLSYSRGGILTYVVTCALIGAAMLAQKGGGIRAVLPWVVIGATILFAGLLAFEQLVARAETVATVDKLRRTKVELWPMLADGTMHTWQLGLGAGAFENGFTRWQTEQLGVTFTHPENIWFQALADWGLVLSAALTALAIVLVRRAWKGVYALPMERVALLALVGLALHDVFDFALELNACAVAAAVTLGCVAGAGSEEHDAARRNVGWIGLMRAVVTSGLAFALAGWGLPTHLEAEAELAELIRQGRSVSEVRAAAVKAINRHPSDWVLYAEVAGDLSRRADGRETLAWVNRELFLRPGDARVHNTAGNALLRLKQPMQALGEFKLAWELGDLTTLNLGIAVALHHDALDRLIIDRKGHLETVFGRVKQQDENAAVRLLDAVEFAPVGAEVRDEAAMLRVLVASQRGEPMQALAALDALPEAQRNEPMIQRLRITLLERSGQRDEALASLERLVARSPGDLTNVSSLIDMLASRGKLAAAHEALERARPFFVGDQRVTLFEREAGLFITEQRWGRAIDALETASRLSPRRADLHYRLAEVFERMGNARSALEAVRQGRLVDTPEGLKAMDPTVKRLEALVEVGP
ncbi:MAG: O-antigen ligase family protein [Archangium sp.]|nr:O-antigen ligase family protein [Archangium sp.]